MEWLYALTPWVKWLHIVFVIFWISGLFMLPRFLVYHQEALNSGQDVNAWRERERRLIRIILDPAMVMVWVFGLILAFNTGAFHFIWFQIKLLFVVILSIFHIGMSGYAGQLSQGVQKLSGKHLRMLNEIPGLSVIVIVFMVVIKPFM